jgi:mycothiol synthase
VQVTVSAEPRITQPEDVERVARFILDWLSSQQFGLDYPSLRVFAGRVASAARGRPGSQIYWQGADGLVATCSIQARTTGSGRQALLQLRIQPDLFGDRWATAIVDSATTAACRLVPDSRLALVVPRGDPLESVLVTRGFEPTMGLITMARAAAHPSIPIAAPAGVTIRPLRPGQDEEGYAAVQRDAFSEDPFGAGLSADDIRNQLEAGIVSPEDFFLAEFDGQLVGVARAVYDAEGRNPDGGPFAEVVGNGVLSGYRRHGIGQALLRSQIAHLEARGASSVCLTVLSLRPDLIEHYRHVGFAETGRQMIWQEP